MKKKAATLILTIYLSCTLNADIKFTSKLYNGEWTKYIGVQHKGPIFINNESFCFITSEAKLLTLDIDGNIINSIDIPSEKSKIYKAGNQIFIIDDTSYYKFDGSKLQTYNYDIRITDNIFYDLEMGLYKIENENKIDLLEDFDDSIKKISGIPTVDPDNDFIYLLLKNNKMYGTLYKYSISKNKLEPLQDKVRHYSVLSEHKLLLYSYNSKYTHLRMTAFPGDFMIIDSLTNNILHNYDEELYNKKHEYVINVFDSNNNGNIIAFGGYMKIEEGSISKSFDPVILLKY